ncbi:MAG: class I SAM-dependent methyltransferase [Alphaproteobacteria bacterium]|nr:class I SAM-dependent methyltransferase [Alphaproteobacteria bacterium]
MQQSGGNGTDQVPLGGEPVNELGRADEAFRRGFPHSSGAVPYFHAAGRGLLPPQWTRPALVVPLDGHYVVEDPVINRPVSWLRTAFARDLPGFKRRLDGLRTVFDAASLPNHDIDGVTPFFPNPYFGPMDATALTGIIQQRRPRRYVEIGSGISTRVARRAVEEAELATSILCIDPAPREPIARLADRIVSDSVLRADLSIFAELSDNDILFFDGSHLSFSGSDCSHVVLEILPLLAPGVHVHLHDIFLPDDYPERLRNRFYNEQQLLAAFLAGNHDYEVVLPIQYLHRLGLCSEGVSFWMRRVGGKGT